MDPSYVTAEQNYRQVQGANALAGNPVHRPLRGLADLSDISGLPLNSVNPQLARLEAGLDRADAAVGHAAHRIGVPVNLLQETRLVPLHRSTGLNSPVAAQSFKLLRGTRLAQHVVGVGLLAKLGLLVKQRLVESASVNTAQSDNGQASKVANVANVAAALLDRYAVETASLIKSLETQEGKVAAYQEAARLAEQGLIDPSEIRATAERISDEVRSPQVSVPLNAPAVDLIFV